MSTHATAEAAPTASVSADQVYAFFVHRYKNNRRAFVEEVLKVGQIEKWQRAVLAELDQGETRISIRSGHGVGKTALLAWTIIHFLWTRYPAKIAVTAAVVAGGFALVGALLTKWLPEPNFEKLHD